jgi:hypothetical protein
MKRLLAAFALIAALAIPAFAEDQPVTTPPNQVATTLPVAVAPPSTPATQNTVTTSGPVSSDTTISVGSIAGQFLAWIMVGFSGPIGGLIVWIFVRVLKNLGITATDAMRARLTEFVVNGLNVSAAAAEKKFAGKDQVEIKNTVVANTIAYVQAHGADTIKALGLDPQSGAAVEAIKARIETAIADPTVPTPAVLDAPNKPL